MSRPRSGRAGRLLAGALRSMTRYRLRSGFMMLGSIVGVAALTLVVSIGNGAERKVLGTVRQLFGDRSILVVAGGSTLLSGPRAASARLTVDDVDAVVRELPAVEAWDAQQTLPGGSVKRAVPASAAVRETSVSGRVLGETERFPLVWSREVVRGEMFDASAMAASARVALVGETIARRLFGDEDPIGQEIVVGAVPLRVIGVLERFGTDVHGLDRDAEIVVPLTTLTRRMMNVDTITVAKILVRREGDVAATTRDVKRLLRARHRLSEGQADDFSVITPIQVQRMVGQMRRVLFVFLPLVAGVALLSGAAVAAALMLASVSQRVAEIGLRKAVGARAEDIRLQFLLEAAVTTLAGGVGGIALGAAGAWLAARRFHLGEIFSWKALLLGIVLSAATGLLAGVLPARRAARLEAAEALRAG